MKKGFYREDETALTKRKVYTKREKDLYNRAVKRCANLVATYDGIIPDQFERAVIVNAIIKFTKR
ncbi:MAG TPA: hypothetical protein PLX17_00520 [Chitinophagaceae bacterium]|nr:hypothetical protein [Chitinophagaceae bacterium]